MCFQSAYKDMDIVTEDLLFGDCSACLTGDCSGNDFQRFPGRVGPTDHNSDPDTLCSDLMRHKIMANVTDC